ncbi:hypothetical protein [Thermaerobacter subterraneus]|uniref:Uncharacterized protein n=1 Tax=Thermaerobacter subterraneus DSM 13965 TaxID=867903 RepID=K6PQJ2_9FIRM|nr:hypothetical protein [Thermaerobacter subterraneus]EKP95212.1 hypothetical protein ThesuDRAFT_00952 [Thermaerobacter subterraneus DSM 13965]
MRQGWRRLAAGVAVAVVAAGVVAWSLTPAGSQWWQATLEGLGRPEAPDPQQLEQVGRHLAASTGEELERAKGNVHGVHERMNQIAGWGHLAALRDAHSPAWNDVQQVLESASLQLLRDVAARLQPPTAGQDLQAFILALEEGYRRRDPGRVRTAHRIIHDLDYFVFNHQTVPGGSRDYWGATLTLEGDGSLAAEVLGAAAGESGREAGQGTGAGE